jgi:hypothetical protein
MVLGTEPRQGPYSEYVVSGVIARQGGGSSENLVVSLVGKYTQSFGDSVLDLREHWIRYQSPTSVAVTDAEGKFLLDIQTDARADSLAIAVSSLDKPTYISRFYSLPTDREEMLKTDEAQMSGCSGCETVTPAQTYVAGYKYALTIGATVPY